METFEPEQPPGATAMAGGVHFTVWSAHAEAVEVCLYAANHERELTRRRLDQLQGGWHQGFIENARVDMRYGYRAHGRWAPDEGYWFDPSKLLLDPYATEIDSPFSYDPRLAEPGFDTAPLVPKAIITARDDPPWIAPPWYRPGGLIYEINVGGFTRRHPDVPGDLRGTVAALASDAVLAHLKKLRVAAVELMPIIAWINERHLPALGLSNAWGYNPVGLMALDPRLAPGGVAELRATVERLHTHGIGVILDLVFNHTGESDTLGPTLSLRGLDGVSYFARSGTELINHTGCGNTLACNHPATRRLILDTLRHFVRACAVDGFRFDLATVLGRTDNGFDPRAPLLREMLADPLLADRVFIAEPWDIGPGGYQLGHFPSPFLEWNDRYRDDVRRFWRGDPGLLGLIATRMAGSADIFQHDRQPITRSVSFVAAHDGMTLADTVCYDRRHNEANGEQNRDGHAENFSWNHGVEGPTDDPRTKALRSADVRAMLATLFATRGPIMLTAGDESGRTQRGNNNAYAQNNPTTWMDWAGRDTALEAYVAELAELRARHPALADPRFIPPGEVRWLRADGAPMQRDDWENPHGTQLAMLLSDIAVLINRGDDPATFAAPAATVDPHSVRFVMLGG